ncbi:MAG: hypothetical protein R3B13_12080 [Polyangiaceae bacterium]
MTTRTKTLLLVLAASLWAASAVARKPVAPGDGGVFPPEGFAGGAANAAHADGAAPGDAGSLKQQLSEVDEQRKQLEKVTQELNEERERLESQMRQAEENRTRTVAFVALAVLVLGIGLWRWQRNKRAS